MKSIFLDLETTGTNPEKNGVYQIGGIICIDDVEIDEFEFYCDIFEEDEINESAFESTSICPNDLKRFPDPMETHKEFTGLLSRHVDKFDPTDKLFFINFGAEFDSKFLRQWFENLGDQFYGSWFWHPPIEVQSLAANYLSKKRHTMKNFKLATVAKELEIHVEETKTHTALYDAHLAKKVYEICRWGEPRQIPF